MYYWNINFPSYYNLEQVIIVILPTTTTIFRLGLLVFLVTFSYATPRLVNEEKPRQTKPGIGQVSQKFKHTSGQRYKTQWL